MSQELIDFSDQIDEHFNMGDIVIEADDFWQSVLNMFIWFFRVPQHFARRLYPHKRQIALRG